MMDEFTPERMKDAIRAVDEGIGDCPVPQAELNYIVRYLDQTLIEPQVKSALDLLKPSVYAANTLLATIAYRKAYEDGTDAALRPYMVACARALDAAAIAWEPSDEDKEMYHIAYRRWRDSGFNSLILKTILVKLGVSV